MKLNTPLKILIGLLTSWEVFYPFLFFIGWMVLVFGAFSSATSQPQSDEKMASAFFLVFFIIFFVMICSSFITLGLKAFYYAHVILNRDGNDATRVILGIGFFLFPFLALPIYYFIYILPEKPAPWALRPTS